MHKPKRKSKYWEQFSYEYDGVTYSGKKNCCEKLGLRYLGVLQHAHDYNCTFEEAISQMLENKQKKEFVFRNKNIAFSNYSINAGIQFRKLLSAQLIIQIFCASSIKAKIMHHFVSVVKSWEYLNAL